MAGFIAFSTGISCVSFAILLPIAGATDISLLLLVLAAVLWGNVFGDYCSPISDTTILSATGASCELMDHVTTQLPYALVAALIASIGYLVLGFFGNMWIGPVIVIFSLIVLFTILRKPDSTSKIDEEPIAK